jgi:hypothetical protein
MSSHGREDLDAKLRRLLSEDQLAALSESVGQSCGMLFDSVGGEGSWQAEFNGEQQRIVCQRVIVRMVAELFEPEQAPKSGGKFTLH